MFRQIKKIGYSPRYSHWGSRGLAVLLVIILTCTILILPASADAAYNTPYNFSCQQPQINDYSCYIEILKSDGSVCGVYVTAALFDVTSNGGDYGGYFRCSVSGENFWVSYFPNTVSDVVTPYVYGFVYYQNGSYASLSNDSSSTGSTGFWLGSGVSIVGIHGYNCDVTRIGASREFTFAYGTDPYMLNMMSTMTTFLNQIRDRISAGNQQIIQAEKDSANDIISNSDDNTNKIIDNQNQLQQNEKDEASSGGSAASDDATSAIPSVDEGFGNSLKSFVQFLSYEGTEAILPIGSIKIPAMAGQEEIVLMDDMEYDLSAAINDFLPETLLTLVRALFTIALILYCVYELYGLIQYFLTLKKGGNDE